jgi:hypothetical protein
MRVPSEGAVSIGFQLDIRRLPVMLPHHQFSMDSMVGVLERRRFCPASGYVARNVFMRDAHEPCLQSHLRFFRRRFLVAFKSRTALHHNSFFPVILFVRSEYMLLCTNEHEQQISELTALNGPT